MMALHSDLPTLRRRVALVFLVALALAVSVRAEDRPLYLDPTQPTDARVEDLLKRMSPQEKLALVHGDSKFTTAAIPRLGIPQRWMSDGPHGVREDVGPYSWEPAGHTNDFSTAMPVLLCLAATWNPDLAQLYGETIGEEARARGKDIMLGPSVNIQRTPLCGRNFEYMGEDPYLTSRTAVRYIRGEQSRDVASCIKHFALNNQELNRGSINVEADERTLREIYLPAFHAAVREAGVLCVMGAYNQFRGQHCCENDLLLNQILKGQWGFKGLVISDWGGVHDTREAALNGMDLEMGSDGKDRSYDEFFLARPFLDGIRAGKFPMSALDEKARRSLRVMFATKVFDKDRAPGAINTPAHQQAARRVAEEGIVLLKNDGALLPLNADRIRSIAVIGENAVRLQSHGGGSAELKAFYEITPLEGILRRAAAKVNVTFSQGYREPEPPPAASRRRGRSASAPAATRDVAGMRRDGEATSRAATSEPADADLIDRAVAAASSADVAIVIGGLNHSRHFDTEGSDRRDMKLPFGQDELIRRVAAANPRTIVVLISGGAVEMDGWLDRVPAIVQAWYPGMEGGNALAGILFGDVNPSGKLPCTFPRRLEDSPAHALGAYPGENGTVRYAEGLLVGYRWFDTKHIEPLFPFGHGLSYTRFEYSNLRLAPGEKDDPSGPAATVQCDIANTGARAGAEVVQVYLHDVASSLPRPVKELKGFAKVNLAPGERRTVSIPLAASALAFYDPQRKAWVAESGDFDVLVGSSSRDIRAQARFHLPATVVLSDQ